MSKREFRRINLDVSNYVKLKVIALGNKTTLENEANIMLAFYVNEMRGGKKK